MMLEVAFIIFLFFYTVWLSYFSVANWWKLVIQHIQQGTWQATLVYSTTVILQMWLELLETSC